MNNEHTLIIPRWDKYNPNFYYFTKRDIDHTILLINENEKIIYTNEMNYDLCYKELGKKFEIKKMNLKEISLELKKRNEKTLIDGSISANLYMQLKNKKMKVGYTEFKKNREIKTENEIKKIGEAVKITRKIIEETDVLGRSENEIMNELLLRTIKKGLKKSFEPIVANSSNARFPHYDNSLNSKIKDYCLIDYGVEFEKYKSDITRCKGNLNENKLTYENLENTTFEIADSSYSGMEIKEFVQIVSEIIKKNKLEMFKHSIGHGIGLEVHEFPSLNIKSEDILKENSVIAIEPGQYNNKNGLRYEDVFLITKKRLKKM